MAGDLRRFSPAATSLLDLADTATGLPLTRVMAEGPPEQLTDTRYAQPAVVATSLATLAALRERFQGADVSPPAFCAGHSVGELAALAAAGALDVEAALRLVAHRAALMAEVCGRVDGSMAAVMGLDATALRQLCEQASQVTGESVEVANHNAPDQLVVSGHRSAIDWIEREGRARGVRRVIGLNVAGPFHSVYMRPAGEAFSTAVAEAAIRTAQTPVVLNETARPTTDPEEIRRELGAQISAPVRWSESLQAMAAAGCTLFVEVGPGQVLSGLVRRTLADAQAISVQDEAGLSAAAEALIEIERRG
jgi:[acyl-carrier-protein] S-malonyltransferase